MHHIVDIILGIVDGMGYLGIFIMMTIESSFIPFPSEVAMIPAGYLSALGKMNIILAFFAGTLWALFGASINYFWGKYLWAPVTKSLVHRYGKYILLNESHYIRSEKYFKKHGAITTLVGRFIPAVRQLISIPAGIFKMPYGKFLLFTGAGAGAWNAILLGIGFVAGKNDELVKQLLSQSFLYIILMLGMIVMAYVYYVKNHTQELQEIEDEIEHNDEVAAKKAKKSAKKVPKKK
jgi:membrane protein DedA with SNARE-associated domain